MISIITFGRGSLVNDKVCTTTTGGLLLGGSLVALGTTTLLIAHYFVILRKNATYDDEPLLLTAHEQLIEAGTPVIKLHGVSRWIGRSIYVKMESLNPGGTGKDRAAWNMIRNAEQEGQLPKSRAAIVAIKDDDDDDDDDEDDDLSLHPTLPIDTSGGEGFPVSSRGNDNRNSGMGFQHQQLLVSMISRAMAKSRTGGLVVEGTSGSTGIALATLCASRGHACLLVLPDDQAVEKQTILRSLGAVVLQVPTAAIANPNHYVNVARKVAQIARDKFNIQAVFIDQFENHANFQMHYNQTGPELWKQMGGRLDAFVMSAGTGGTISGIAKFLKEQTFSHSEVKIVLVDPRGSSLYHKVEHGVAYAPQQQERTLQKHRYDTIAEGIGLDRVTDNIAMGLDYIDNAIRVTDQEAVDMAHFILRTEGLWIGSSSAMNLVGAIRTALDLPRGARVLTMICDGGQRHVTRFWNPEFIQNWGGLQWPHCANCIPECLRSHLKTLD
jgi:cysteine synthase